MIHKCKDKLPEDETRVLILYQGEWKIGMLFWETPGFEDTFKAFRYWDDPEDDGKYYEWYDITHWTELPPTPPELTEEELEEWHTSYTKAQASLMINLSSS